MSVLARGKPTMMSKKFYSMLLGGTLTMMVVAVLLVSDSIIAGAVIGPDAVAGVTLAAPLYSLTTFFASMISLGIPVLYTTAVGEFDKERADHIFGVGVLMCIIVGIVLFVLTSVFGTLYLRSSSPSEEILAQAKGYLFWMRFAILLLPMQMLIASVVYSDGDEKTSTLANLVQGVGNIAFSILLSHVMGIRGISLASFAFNAVSILILCAHFRKESNTLRWNLYFSLDVLKNVVRFSIIDSSTYLFIAVMTSALNAFISAEYGTDCLILASAITLVRNLQLIFDGVGSAISPVFSIYRSEENHQGMRSAYALSNRMAIIEGIAVSLILLIIAPLVPRVLHVVQPELARQVVAGIRLTGLGSAFVALLYLLTSYYLVIGQIALGVAVCALRDVLLSAGLGVVLGKVFGVSGMFVGLAAAPAVAYGLLMLFLRARYGKADCPLLLSKVPGSDRSWLFQLAVEPAQIIDLQKKVEAVLLENHLDRCTVGFVKLLIEELYILISEKNEGRTVLSECTVSLRPGGVQIIIKDDGVLFDISQEDVSVTSLTSFAVSAYMEKLGDDRRHLTTMSYNRTAFLIKPLASEKEL